MLFYQTRRPNAFSTRHVISRPFTTAEAGERLHATWMLKTVGMGVTLLGLSYWLVHIAGVQYLASLTSATLVAFLLAYMVWWLRRSRFARQRDDGASRMEAGHSSPVVGPTVPPTPTPPPPFHHHRTYKYVPTAPDRDPSPPPTYEEAIRTIMSMTACAPELTYRPSISPDTGPQPSQQQSADLPSPPAPTASIPSLNSSTTQLSPSALISSPSPSDLMPSPQTAVTSSLSSPSASTPDSAPAVETPSPLTQQASPQ